jgi:hypothetical protein
VIFCEATRHARESIAVQAAKPFESGRPDNPVEFMMPGGDVLS